MWAGYKGKKYLTFFCGLIINFIWNIYLQKNRNNFPFFLITNLIWNVDIWNRLLQRKEIFDLFIFLVLQSWSGSSIEWAFESQVLYKVRIYLESVKTIADVVHNNMTVMIKFAVCFYHYQVLCWRSWPMPSLNSDSFSLQSPSSGQYIKNGI